MNKILIAIVILTAIIAQAENTEFVTVAQCITAESSLVNVERRVVDIYTANARFEERVVVAELLYFGSQSEEGYKEYPVLQNSFTQSTHTYVADGLTLAATWDWNSMTLTSTTGNYTVKGTGSLNVRGEAQRSLKCELYDSL